MSNETYITVRGYAGAEPTAYDNGNGLMTVVVRVGVTARIRDRETHRYRDGTTSWYSVRCYGDLGLNVTRSVRRGTPVLVRGRLVERAWTAKDGIERTDLSIIADSLGIEISSGVANFVKVRHVSLDSDGRPIADSASTVKAPQAQNDAGGVAGTDLQAVAAGTNLPTGKGSDCRTDTVTESCGDDALHMGSSMIVRGGQGARTNSVLSDVASEFDSPALANNEYREKSETRGLDPAGVLQGMTS